MDKEFDIDSIVASMDFKSGEFVNLGNFMLTNREIEVLDRYKIDYKKCNTAKEVIFEIEDILNDMDIIDEDLEYISGTISERDYYQNTNK